MVDGTSNYPYVVTSQPPFKRFLREENLRTLGLYQKLDFVKTLSARIQSGHAKKKMIQAQ